MAHEDARKWGRAGRRPGSRFTEEGVNGLEGPTALSLSSGRETGLASFGPKEWRYEASSAWKRVLGHGFHVCKMEMKTVSLPF